MPALAERHVCRVLGLSRWKPRPAAQPRPPRVDEHLAGLIWGLLLGSAGFGIKVFFLSCVLIAGVFGAVTAKRSILWIQGMPAAVALVVLWLARS